MAGTSFKSGSLEELTVDKINFGDFNVRTLDRDKKVDELAESIEKYGLLQPIVVLKEKDKIKVVIGQRRLRAYKKLKQKNPSKFNRILAVMLKGKPEEEYLKILSLSENIHRVELNRADIVEVISYLYEKNNSSVKIVAKILGKSVGYVYDHLKIQAAPEEVKKMLSRNEITKEDVKRAMEISDGDKERTIELAKEMKKLTPYERKRFAAVSKIKPKAQAKELAKEAKKPYVEEKIVVPLDLTLSRALNVAAREIGLPREEVAKKAIQEWLGNKGYFKEQ